MKNLKYIYLIAVAGLISILFACTNQEAGNPNLSGTDITLSTQAEVNAFKNSADIRTLTITGTDITDLSALPVQNVKNLIIDNTGIVNLNIPSLRSATVSIQLLNNANLAAIDGLKNLSFFGGNFLIENNDKLFNIAGILGIKTFFGTLTIKGNAILGENIYPMPSDQFGFYPIKTMINNGIISGAKAVILADNHPLAVNDATLIGVPTGNPVLDYILRSKSDCLNFKNWNSDGIVNNITISGGDVDAEALMSLRPKIKKIMGTFKLMNAPIGNFDGTIFNDMKIYGGLHVENLPNIDNINSFNSIRGELTGDVIIIDMPNIDFSWDEPWPAGSGFQKITKIGGDLIIRNCNKFETGGFKNLTYVGGDFVFENLNRAGHFGPMDKITYIGGNISIKNFASIISLWGLHNVQYIGGSMITITDTPKIPTVKNGPDLWNLPGFCLIKDAWNAGVIKNPNCVITLSNTQPVDFATLSGCQ